MASQAEIDGIFPEMVKNFIPAKAEGVDTTIQFELSGDNGGTYWLKISPAGVEHGTGATDAGMTVKANADDFFAIATGQMNPMQAFMMGKIKVSDTMIGMKMIQMFGMG
jgi:putative sterol carrier protein